jgi:ribosomal protein L29
MLEMKEIKTWDERTILNKVKALKKDVFNLKMQLNVSGLDKPHLMYVMRKDVARLETVLSLRKKGLLTAAPATTTETKAPERKTKAPRATKKKKEE